MIRFGLKEIQSPVLWVIALDDAAAVDLLLLLQLLLLLLVDVPHHFVQEVQDLKVSDLKFLHFQ